MREFFCTSLAETLYMIWTNGTHQNAKYQICALTGSPLVESTWNLS